MDLPAELAESSESGLDGERWLESCLYGGTGEMKKCGCEVVLCDIANAVRRCRQ